MTVALGSLYVTGQSVGNFEPPVLMRVSTGTFEIVARIGSPLIGATTAGIGAPAASGQFVYFALTSPQIAGISVANYIGVYDILAGSYSHLGNQDGTDVPPVGIRGLACNGRAVSFGFTTGGNGWLQFQTNSSKFSALPSAPAPVYAAGGWIVMSRMDFNTPSIRKTYRRITVVHAPLNVGESIVVKAFVDTDPLKFTTSLAPVPANATVTHAYSGGDADPGTTILVFPTATIARDMFYAIQLNAGTSQATTPVYYYSSVEIAPGWVIDFTVDCTQQVGMIGGDTDDQGITAKDRYWLLRNAQDDANVMTVYHPNGDSYTMEVESIEFDNPSPLSTTTPQGPRSVEWYCHLLLRKVA